MFVVDEEFLRSKNTEDLKLYDDAVLPRLRGKREFSYCNRVLEKVLKKEACAEDEPF